MFKKLLIVFFFISAGAQSQHSITGIVSPKNDSIIRVILYQLKGTKQVYISNSKIDNDQFKLEIPKGAEAGMYRLTFSPDVFGFIDFIFDQESVLLKFDSRHLNNSVEFLTSEENKTYANYLAETVRVQQKLDSLQIAFFGLKDKKQDKITIDLYVKTLSDYNNIQSQFEGKTEGKLANHFVKATRKYFSPALFVSPQEYLNSVKQHYFDFINFKESALKNSTFFSEKAIEYVFYLNVSDNFQVQNALYKNAIGEVMQKVGENNALKSDILISLIYAFEQFDNMAMAGFVIDEFYSKLPANLIDAALVDEMRSKINWQLATRRQKLSGKKMAFKKN